MQETSGNQSADAAEAPAARPRPLLVYDGDCGFCAYWARYWQKLTGDSVEYRPYQEVAAQYPAISHADFQRAVQFITPDGRHASAAEASFLTLSHARGKGFWLALYRNLPGFAASLGTRLRVHRRAPPGLLPHQPAAVGQEPRAAALRSRLIPVPAPVRADLPVGLRLLRRAGAGADRQPRHPAVAELVDALAGRLGPERFFLMPMVFWMNDSDAAIQAVCWAGAGLSLLLVFNLLPRLTLFLLYALYLSLFYAGQTFMSFQWDTFLLETGFLALLLSFATTPGIWLRAGCCSASCSCRASSSC